jgi:aspartate/glutamate racemase
VPTVPTIGFLHTAAVHVATFDDLVREIDPQLRTAVIVRESVLSDAREFGPGDQRVRDEIERALDELEADGASVVVCTCSTVGGVAEALGRGRSIPVTRVDRPMAAAAVRLGPRIVVVAAVDSTVAPTRQLIESIASECGARVEITDVVCVGAWASFEAGDLDDYLDKVAATCSDLAADCDVIVLAQASMAGAAGRANVDVPILSSPHLAVRAAVDHLRG